jgi:RNA polymerase sigma-70 factor (ECF subfamily)
MTEDQYNDCVNAYADGLYRFIVKNLRHDEDARDIVQNSFEILWKHHRGLAAEKARAYLFTVGYHNMIDHIRRSRRVSLVGEVPETGRVNPEGELQVRSAVMGALEQLSEVQRSLVMLKDYEGYSYEEIGGITGLNASQVKVYLHRARLKMKAYIVKMENIV